MQGQDQSACSAHRLALVLLILLMWSPCTQYLHPAFAAGPASQPAIFYVSLTGDDGNSGTTVQAPFKTIQKAMSAVRSIVVAGMQSDVTVILRGGNYYLSQPLSFGPQDSGGNGYRVIYRSYPNEEAAIVGGQPITNWQQDQGPIYKAFVGNNWEFYTLLENGARAVAARAPSSGYLAVDSTVRGFNHTRFAYKSGDLPSFFDYSHLQAYVWSGGAGVNDWLPDLIPVKSVNFTSRTITLNHSTTFDMAKGDRFFVQNSRDFLTKPGEFYLDVATGYLYYWPVATPIDQQEIVAPTVKRIIDISGTSASTVHDIVFEDLTLTVSDFGNEATGYNPLSSNAAVFVTNAAGITLRFSKIQNAGAHGVLLQGSAQGNVIYGNLIENAGINCVWLAGFPQGYAQKNNLVSNNLVRNCGQLHGYAYGILLWHSGGNIISHNTVTNVPRSGISFIGADFNAVRQFANPIATQQNYKDYVWTRDNVVGFNDVSRFMTDSSDNGGIYTAQTGRNNTIQNNLVHDSVSSVNFLSSFHQAFIEGLYFDDGSDYLTVKNNIVYGVSGVNAFPVFMKGTFNNFTNNVVVGGGPQAEISCWAFGGVRNDHLTITRNILYDNAKNSSDALRFVDWTQDKVSTSNNNTFFHASGAYNVAFGGWWVLPGGASSRATLDQWRSTYGFDKNSVAADPLFLDITHNNYTLGSSSPALRLGFVNIDTKRVGLPSGSPFLIWPVTWLFQARPGQQNSTVSIISNSTLDRFVFSQSGQQMQFYVAGRDGTSGFAKVSIPRSLLDGQLVVLLDGLSHSFTLSSNSTYHTINLSYIHSIHQIRITTLAVVPPTSTVTGTSTATTTTPTSTSISSTTSGGGGIPEFPFQLLPTIAFAAVVVIAFAAVKRRMNRRDVATS